MCKSTLRKFNNKGMSTIEACVIIPISMTVTMLLIWLGFFYFNRNLLAESASQAAVYGTEFSNFDNETIKRKVIGKLDECIKDKTIFLKNVDYSVIVESRLITVSVKADLDIPSFIVFGNLYKKDIWSMEFVKKAPRLRNSLFVRTINRIKESERNTEETDL